MADGDPFKKYGGQQIDGDPFKKYGGTAIAEPEKKKESLGSAFGGLALPVNGKPQSGFGYMMKGAMEAIPEPPTDKEKLTNYLQGLKTPEEISYAQKSPANSRQLAYNTGQQQLENIMATGGHEDPMSVAKKNMVESPDMQDRLKNYMANRYIQDKVDGVDAKNILSNTEFGKKGNDNLTASTLKQKVNQYDQNVAPIKNALSNIKSHDGGDLLNQDLSKHNQDYLDFEYKKPIDDAAIEYMASKDPSFKKELESGAKPNDFKIGQAREAMLNDPDVLAMITKEHPNLLPAFKNAQAKLISDHPEYGINTVANEVSRAVNKTGFNNIDPIVNYYGDEHKKMADQVANQLYRDQSDKLAIWNKYIKDNQEKYLDAPSFLQGFAQGGKEFGQGVVNTFTEPFTSVSQDVKDKWQKEAENVSANPDDILKFLQGTGHALGTVASIAATGNVLGGTEAANMTAIGTGFLGDQLEQKKLMYPDSPVKAWASALLNTGMYMAMGKNIFPASKINKALGETSPEIEDVVKNLTDGAITRDAAAQQLNSTLKKAINLAGGTLSKNAKITAELTGIDVLGKMVDKVLGGNPSDEDEIEKAGATFLSNLGVAGLAKYGEMRNGNKIVENSLDKAANEPLQTTRTIDALNESQEVKDQMKDNLTFLTGIKNKLVEDGVDPKQHSRFLLEALREKVAKESNTTGAFTRKSEEQIKQSQDIQDKILNGEDVVGANEISKPIELNPELPKDYQLPDQQKFEAEVNIPAKELNAGAQKLEAEKNSKIDEAMKPDLPDIKEISDKNLVGSKDRGNNIIRHDEITDKLRKLKDILNCFWA